MTRPCLCRDPSPPLGACSVRLIPVHARQAGIQQSGPIRGTTRPWREARPVGPTTRHSGSPTDLRTAHSGTHGLLILRSQVRALIGEPKYRQAKLHPRVWLFGLQCLHDSGNTCASSPLCKLGNQPGRKSKKVSVKILKTNALKSKWKPINFQ